MYNINFTQTSLLPISNCFSSKSLTIWSNLLLLYVYHCKSTSQSVSLLGKIQESYLKLCSLKNFCFTTVIFPSLINYHGYIFISPYAHMEKKKNITKYGNWTSRPLTYAFRIQVNSVLCLPFPCYDQVLLCMARFVQGSADDNHLTIGILGHIEIWWFMANCSVSPRPEKQARNSFQNDNHYLQRFAQLCSKILKVCNGICLWEPSKGIPIWCFKHHWIC